MRALEPVSSPAFRIRPEMYQEAATDRAMTTSPASTEPGTIPARNRRIPSQTIHTPVRATITDMKMVPSVSAFPCPYGCEESGGSIDFRIER